ncbi:MAG: DegV family protein [Clostridia bacterium]|nr:DegV family protein [Clostridia bacterium]
MNDYVIITDSTADLPKAIIDELGVSVFPLQYVIDGETFTDIAEEGDKPIIELYNKMRNGAKPSTSQITLQTFLDGFSSILKEGKDVLYIGFSSGLSGTAGQAILAAKELQEEFTDNKVIAIDTLAASLGEGMIVYYAAKLKQEGKSIEEVAEWVENNKLRLAHWFTVDDLVYLKRGGRVSPAVAVIGTLLGIKPVLHVDNEGHLISVCKVRGRKASLDELVKRAAATIEDAENQTIFICHGDCIEDAEYLANKCKEELKVKDVIIGYTGPVIGSHSGPGTIALFTFGKNRD